VNPRGIGEGTGARVRVNPSGNAGTADVVAYSM